MRAETPFGPYAPAFVFGSAGLGSTSNEPARAPLCKRPVRDLYRSLTEVLQLVRYGVDLEGTSPPLQKAIWS